MCTSPHRQSIDQSSMNLTAVDSSVSEVTFPRVQLEVNSLKATMCQLTQLLQSDDAGDNVTIQMEVECGQTTNRPSTPLKNSTKTLSFNSPEDKTAVNDNIQNLLDTFSERIRNLSALYVDVREQVDTTLRDVLAAVTQTDLTNRANLDLERELAFQAVQGASFPTGPTSVPPSALDQTVVFELLEKMELESRDELTRLKADYETQLEQHKSTVNRLEHELESVRTEHTREFEDLLLECHQAKNLSNRLKAEIEQLQTERYNECEELRQECRQAKEDSERLRSDLDILRSERSKEYEELRSDYNQIKYDFDHLKQNYEQKQAEHIQKYEDLWVEYSQVKATLQAIVDRYVPHPLFPLVREPLPRLSHVLDTILRRCPWLFSAITDENQDPELPLPNPIHLLEKQQHLCEKLVLERNDAQDKLQRVTAELELTQEGCSSLRTQLDSVLHQQELSKEEIDRLSKQVTRYRSYMRKIFDPKVASRLAAMCTSAAPVAGADVRSENINGTPQSWGGLSSSIGCSDEGSTISSKPSPKQKTENQESSSSSVFSKVGAAVSALATAIVSPRRKLGTSRSQETLVIAPTDTPRAIATASYQTSYPPKSDADDPRDGSFHKHIPPEPYTKTPTAVPTSFKPQTHSTTCTITPPVDRITQADPLFEPNVAPFRVPPVPSAKPPIESTALPRPEPQLAPTPFAMPAVPRAPHPTLGKRRVLGEIPISVAVDTTHQPDPIPVKPVMFDPNASFFNVNPLAESTSGPFPKPPQPFTGDTKRIRYDQHPPLKKSPGSGPSKHDAPPAPRSTALRIQTPGQPKKSGEDLQDCVIS